MNVSESGLICLAFAAGILVPTLSPATPEAGQRIFSSTCAGCHGLDGRGGEHGPNIATTPTIQQRSDADLFRIVHDGIPGSGMPAFGSALDHNALNSVVAYLHVLQGKGTATSLPGDPNKGRSLFFGRAHCSQCHMIDGRGGFLGTDLSDYATSHTPAEIRTAILDPDTNLDPRRGIVKVVLRDGRKYSGIARNEDNFSLQLQTVDGAFHFFDKSSLKQVEHLPRSFMPSDYRATLTAVQLDDLVSYLVHGAHR